MHVRTFIEGMERLAPPELAEEFDAGKIGLVVEGMTEIANVFCALDATPFVVKQAVAGEADMLVVHHTPLWTPVTAMTGRTALLMRDLLSSGMNLYVMHTNFDRADGGVNDALAGLLSLGDCIPMSLGKVGSCTIPSGRSPAGSGETSGSGERSRRSENLPSSREAGLTYRCWKRQQISVPMLSYRRR